MNAPPLHGVARTLALTLRGRAEEHARPDGLFRDSLAAAWLAHLPPDPSWDAWYMAAFQTGVAIRAQIFDALAAAFLATNPEPLVVELGAGLSTRYDRLAPAGGQWIELDLPAVIALRHTLESETATHTFLAASLAEHAWVDAVPATRPQQTLLLAEGVLPFLDPPAVHALITLLRTGFPGATLIFDVIGTDYNAAIRAFFAQQDAPLRWSIADLDELAALGLDLVQTTTLFTQHHERWSAVGLDPHAFDLRSSGAIVVAQLQEV